MSAHSLRTPSYRLHKPTGKAVVTLAGRDFYLGRHGSEESRVEYDRLVAEWLVSGRRLPASVAEPEVTVNELMLAYFRHAQGYYLKDGKPTSEVRNIGIAIRPVRNLYGHSPARNFGPLALKAVRQALIESGICRNEVNKRVRHTIRAFKWAAAEEMIPASVYHGLQAVTGLRRGRSEARETAPVKPVPEAFVDAIRPYVSRQVWAMVQIQSLAGMRPGEVCIMRTQDVDTSGRVWVFTPGSHKTQHHGKERRIYLGPQAQAILRPWLRPELSAYLFSPADVVAERKAELRRNRKTPVQPSQRNRAKPKPQRKAGDFYETDAYRRAIARACKAADVPDWHPHQLRHNAATRLRKEFGLDAARAVLGHSSTSVTEIYAELDGAKAEEAMARVG